MGEFKTFIKKRWMWILLAIFLIVIGIFYFYASGVEETGTTKLMSAISEGNQVLIKRFEKRQVELTGEIAKREEEIARQEKNIAAQSDANKKQSEKVTQLKASLKEREVELTKMMEERRNLPTNANFKTLDDCILGFNLLHQDCKTRLNLSASDFNDYKKYANGLFSEYETEICGYVEEIAGYITQIGSYQKEIKSQNNRYNECQNQVQLLTTENTGYKISNSDLEKKLKKKKRSGLWTFLKNYGSGIVTGCLIYTVMK
jgi:septal ring factor EnvC (AmiA/AmiB activator)